MFNMRACYRSSVAEVSHRSHLIITFQMYPIAWYDYELVQYQKDRSETELEKTFQERKEYLAQQESIEFTPNKAKTKEPEPEWAQQVRTKKGEGYYNKLHDLENEQVVKESRLRESTHQYAIPGEKVVNTSMAKGMAQMYETNV